MTEDVGHQSYSCSSSCRIKSTCIGCSRSTRVCDSMTTIVNGTEFSRLTRAPSLAFRHGNQTATTYRVGAVFAPVVDHQLYFSSSSSFTPVIDVPDNGTSSSRSMAAVSKPVTELKHSDGKVQADFAWYHIEQNNLVFSGDADYRALRQGNRLARN